MTICHPLDNGPLGVTAVSPEPSQNHPVLLPTRTSTRARASPQRRRRHQQRHRPPTSSTCSPNRSAITPASCRAPSLAASGHLSSAAGHDHQVRERLAGIETADMPGAVALTRLDNLAALAPPQPRPTRPQWRGQCDERTRASQPMTTGSTGVPTATHEPRQSRSNQVERQRGTGSASVDRP